jgi:hypothetical protein
MEDFSCFTWMTLSDPPKRNNVETCIQYLLSIGVAVDDVECFDQLVIKKSTESRFNNEKFTSLLAHQKWTRYLKTQQNCKCHSELLKLSQLFATSPHNANVDRVFSLMQVR